jgi:hypothetical protein
MKKIVEEPSMWTKHIMSSFFFNLRREPFFFPRLYKVRNIDWGPQGPLTGLSKTKKPPNYLKKMVNDRLYLVITAEM